MTSDDVREHGRGPSTSDGVRVDHEAGEAPAARVAADAEVVAELQALRREMERLRVVGSRDRGRLTALLDHSPHGIIVSDPQGRLVLHNRAAERIWAGSATAASVADWSQYRAFHPDGRPYAGEDWSMARVLRDGVVVEAEEMRIQRFDGTHGWLIGSSAPIRDADGRLDGAIAIFADITRLKQAEMQKRRAERLLTAYHAVAAVLAEVMPMELAMPRVLEAVCLALEWPIGLWWAVAPGGERLQLDALWEMPGGGATGFAGTSRGAAFAPGEGLPGRVWQSGRPAWVDDVLRDPAFTRRDAAAGAGLHGAFAFPLAQHGRVVGVVEFYSHEVHEGDDDLRHLVDAISQQLAHALDRVRAQAAIREGEALKSAILAAALDCVITIDDRGRVLEFNPAAEVTFGHARADVLGKDLADLIIPVRFRAAHRAGLARHLATGAASMLGRRVELTALHKDGRELPVEIAVTPVETGERRLYTAFFRDISERKHAEEVQRFILEASKELASTLDFEAALRRLARLAVPALADWCAVDLVGDDGLPRRVEIVHRDPAMLSLVEEVQRRWPPAPDPDRGVLKVIRTGEPEVWRDIPEELLARAAQDDAHLAAIRRLGLRSAATLPLRARGRTLGALSLVFAESGRRYGEAELRVAEDLARRAAIAIDNARLFRERDDAIAALERSNADLDQFAYVTSHDLKAPLRGISSLAQWIEEDLGEQLTEQARDYLRLIRGRVDRLAGLIEGILQYSRAGRTRSPVALVVVADLLAETVQLLAPPPGATVRLVQPLPVLEAERVPLQQIFLNLVGNAVKHAGRPDLTVEVSCHDAGELWEFAVKDDGPGIAPEFHERMWGVFQTLRPRDQFESTGIGLSVVRRIAQQQGGHAWVESAVGQGATFRFTWPKRPRQP